LRTLAPAPAWYEPPDDPPVVYECENCGREMGLGERAYATPDGIVCGDCLVMFAEDYVIDEGIVRAGYLNKRGELE